MVHFGKIQTTVFIAAAFALAMMSAEAQEVATCATALTPCADYLNATKTPPASCCDPLKETVDKQLKCLCDLYSNTDLLKSIGINATQAVRLPSLCGVRSDLCQGRNNTSPSSGPVSGSPKNDDSSPKNYAGRLASTGIFSGLLISASLMLY